jgi:hypothetical protein
MTTKTTTLLRFRDDLQVNIARFRLVLWYTLKTIQQAVYFGVAFAEFRHFEMEIYSTYLILLLRMWLFLLWFLHLWVKLL